MLSATYKLQTGKEIAEEKKNKRIAFLVSVGVYVLLLLLVLMFALHPPDPPLPQAEGIEVVLGTDEVGMNPVFEQPAPSNAQPQPEQPVEKVTPTVPEPVKIETSNDPEAPVVKETKKEPVEEKKPVEEERKVNKRALFEKTPGTGGEGTNTQSKGTGDKAGNQGDPNGSKDATHWEGHGLGNDGAGFELAGRGKVSLPQPENPTNQGGIVVVAIEVDRDGNVVSARGGVRGSTTANATLIELAERYAKKARFTPKADAPKIQSGKIRYNFKLQ